MRVCQFQSSPKRKDETAKICADGNKAGEIWSIALSEDGQYLAATSFDGRINVWDNLANGAKIREFETKGSFGMSIDLVCYYLQGASGGV